MKRICLIVWFLLCRYDRANTFRKMVDCQFVAAMGPPGGGRSFITPRFARHFHHVSICELDNKSMTLIFGTILGNFFKQVLIIPTLHCDAAQASQNYVWQLVLQSICIPS